MSLGGDGYGGDAQVTRTRLPEGEIDPYAAQGRRGAARPKRSLVMVVGVVVLLLAAIAFANRGGSSSGSGSSAGGSSKSGKTGSSSATAPSGVKPVEGKNGGIPSGFAHTEQGAQSAASNYAVALVSADILQPERRHEIVQQVFSADVADDLQKKLDGAYSKDFLSKVGLNENGEAPRGMTYVSRTAPVGAKTTEYSESSASVDVWCTGVFGMAGTGSTKPVTNDWFTMSIKLRWVDGDWKAQAFSQKNGPAPVSTDQTASSADEISKAVQQYGGFTYAR